MQNVCSTILKEKRTSPCKTLGDGAPSNKQCKQALTYMIFLALKRNEQMFVYMGKIQQACTAIADVKQQGNAWMLLAPVTTSMQRHDSNTR